MTINQRIVQDNVLAALAEDCGSGDVTAALLPADLQVEAEIISREPLLLCGQPWVNAVFAAVDPELSINWLYPEGAWLDKPVSLCQIKGRARSILTAERTALNFLQTLSATATQTHAYLEQLKGYSTRLLDTRKTLPGLRYAQKYAVACAGGVNHRLGLYDAFLIKENHIKACGSITLAISKARAEHPELFVEIEVENLQELKEALKAAPDRIMLDNFNEQDMVEAVEINKAYGCMLEASGNVGLNNLASIASTGVDFISVGAITKSIRAIDLSLLIREVK